MIYRYLKLHLIEFSVFAHPGSHLCSSSDFQPHRQEQDEKAIVSLQDRIIQGTQTHEEGFAEWLRQRDQQAMVAGTIRHPSGDDSLGDLGFHDVWWLKLIMKHDEHMMNTWWAYDEHMMNIWWTHDEHMMNIYWTHDEHMMNM